MQKSRFHRLDPWIEERDRGPGTSCSSFQPLKGETGMKQYDFDIETAK